MTRNDSAASISRRRSSERTTSASTSSPDVPVPPERVRAGSDADHSPHHPQLSPSAVGRPSVSSEAMAPLAPGGLSPRLAPLFDVDSGSGGEPVSRSEAGSEQGGVGQVSRASTSRLASFDPLQISRTRLSRFRRGGIGTPPSVVSEGDDDVNDRRGLRRRRNWPPFSFARSGGNLVKDFAGVELEDLSDTWSDQSFYEDDIVFERRGGWELDRPRTDEENVRDAAALLSKTQCVVHRPLRLSFGPPDS